MKRLTYYQGTYLHDTKYLTYLVLMKGTRPQKDTEQKANGFCDSANRNNTVFVCTLLEIIEI